MKVLQAYCFKCRTMRGIRNPSQVTLKNGHPATRGHCPVCYTRVFRIGLWEEVMPLTDTLYDGLERRPRLKRMLTRFCPIWLHDLWHRIVCLRRSGNGELKRSLETTVVLATGEDSTLERRAGMAYWSARDTYFHEDGGCAQMVTAVYDTDTVVACGSIFFRSPCPVCTGVEKEPMLVR